MDSKTATPLTTYEVSRYLQVDLTTVINWCEQGRLRAYKTPGGHRRIEMGDLFAFLKEYRMPVPSALEERSRGKLSILIVDDEQEIRKMIRKSLKKNLPLAEIWEAQDGFEAGKMVLDKAPGLVILDLKLPGIDGFRVCANIKSDERLKHTQILAITGQSTTDNKQKILAAGADDFLAKPFEVADLLRKVMDLLETATVPAGNLS